MTSNQISNLSRPRTWTTTALTMGLLSSTVLPAFGQAASGNIFNQATVNGTFGPADTPLFAPGSEPADDATVPLVTPTPQYVATKTVTDPGQATAGSVLTYTLAVQNTGNITLVLDAGDILDSGPSFGATGPNALDAAFSLDVARDTNADLAGDGGDLNGDGQINPGETFYFTAPYTLTQADIDASAGIADGVTNTAAVTVETPSGGAAQEDPGTPSDLVAEATIDLDADLGFTKVAYDTAYSNDGDPLNDGAPIIGPVNAGQTIYYRFTITNNANVTVNGIAINDPGALINGSATAVAFTTAPTQVDGGDTTLAPGEQAVFEATYLVTQSDVDGQ